MTKLTDPFDNPAPQEQPKSRLTDPFDVLPEGGGRNAQAPGGTGADAEALRRGYEPVGTYDPGSVYNEGGGKVSGAGTIYKAPDGQMLFISPGYTTSDPDAIKNMMAGDRPQRPKISGPMGDLKSAYHGFTFGKGDEAVAAIGATVDSVTGEGDWQDQYDAHLARERADLDQYREERPIRSAVAEIAGSIPTALVAGGPATRGPMLVRMARGAGTGTALGVDYGFSSGEGGFGERVQNAAVPAAVGGVLGAGAPVVGQAVGAARNRYLLNRAAERAESTPAAYTQVARALDADDALGQAASRRLADADSMLADVGPAASGLVDLAVQTSGPAGGTARRAVEARVSRAGGRITQAMDDTLGRPGESSSRALVPYGDRTNPLTSLYNRAYAQPIDYTTDGARSIMDMVENRVPASAIKAAKDLMRTEGNMSKQMFAEIADDGTVTITRLPDVRELDYLTRGLQQVAKEADGKGAMGGTTPVGRAYGNLATEIRDTLKELVPEWGQAVGEARKLIGAKKARDLGRNDLFKPNMYREDLAPMLARMSPEEKAKVAEGVRMRIDETLANVKRTAADSDVQRKEAIKALKDMSSRATEDKLAMVVGRDKAARMAREIDGAAQAFELESRVATGSQTFTRKEGKAALDSLTNDGVVNAFRSGQPVNTGQRLVQALLGRTQADKQRINDETMSAVVAALMRRGPQARLTAQQMLDMTQRVDPGTQRASMLAEALTRRLAATAGSTTQPLR